MRGRLDTPNQHTIDLSLSLSHCMRTLYMLRGLRRQRIQFILLLFLNCRKSWKIAKSWNPFSFMVAVQKYNKSLKCSLWNIHFSCSCLCVLNNEKCAHTRTHTQSAHSVQADSLNSYSLEAPKRPNSKHITATHTAAVAVAITTSLPTYQII